MLHRFGHRFFLSHSIATSLCCLWLGLLAACSTLPAIQPIPPEVEIASIDVVTLGLSEQELAFTLDVFNPNNFDLPVSLLKFIASRDQETIANGRTTDPVLLSAEENTQVIVNVTMQANRLLQQLIVYSINRETVLDYNVTGFVKLDNWPARIPFNMDKTIELD